MANTTKRKRLLFLALGLAGAALLAWIFLHPYRQAEVNELTPALRDWVLQKPFGDKFDAKIRHATLRSKTSYGESFVTTILQQSVSVPAPGITRKTTHYYASGNSVAVQEENTRLTAGTLLMVTHYRNPLPFVGDLLPYAFWYTRKMRDLKVVRNSGFPEQPNGQFLASYVIDELHADGSLSKSITETMHCEVTGTRPAAAFLASLKGDAVLYRCEIKTIKSADYSEEARFEYVYFPALAWSYSNVQTIKNNVVDTEMRIENTLVAIE